MQQIHFTRHARYAVVLKMQNSYPTKYQISRTNDFELAGTFLTWQGRSLLLRPHFTSATRFGRSTVHRSSTSRSRPCRSFSARPEAPSRSKLSHPTGQPLPRVISSWGHSSTTTPWTTSWSRVRRPEFLFKRGTFCRSSPRTITTGGRRGRWPRPDRQDSYHRQNFRYNLKVSTIRGSLPINQQSQWNSLYKFAA